MLPVKRILCPTDFSDPSHKGIFAANELAEHFGAELILMSVVIPIYPVSAPGVPPGYSADEYYKQTAKFAANTLEEIVEEKISDAVPARYVVVEGNAADEIVKQSELDDVDLIVIATHGWTGWRRLVFGSVTDKVLRLAACPVLTISGRNEP